MFTEAFFKSGEADPRALRQLGITRVGDITGLDVIGLPVWFATRPNSRALSVSQGKGLSDAQARISAIMESAETAIAEQPEELIKIFGSLKEVTAQGATPVPLDSLLRCNISHFDPARERGWLPGHSVVHGRDVLAPYELIGLDLRARGPWDHKAFQMSSIGLAAGGDALLAELNALLEVIEHDATSSLELLGLGARLAVAIDIDGETDASLQGAIAQLGVAGFEPHFFDISGAVALPVIACFLQRQVISADGVGEHVIAGFACRPDAGHAALAALLECVQSRATDIAGARDDISDPTYRASRVTLPAQVTQRRSLSQVRGHRPATSLPTLATTLDHVRAAVFGADIEDIFVFPLSHDVAGLHVTRVLVPGLAVASVNAIEQGGAALINALLGSQSA